VEPDASQVAAREEEGFTRAGLAGVFGALLAFGGFLLLQVSLSGDTNYESLREAHEKASTIWMAGSLTAIGYVLLTVPLLFLFRAAQARSPRMRNQFIGLVLLGPILLGVSGLGLAAGTQEAANTYLDGKADSTLTVKEATKECREEEKDKGKKEFAEEFEGEAAQTPIAACVVQNREEDRASNAIRDSSLVTISQFVGLAGGLSLVVALLYTCLWGMRAGLLTRFWGSLGMAVGVAALIGLTPLALIWFLYLGVLLLGKVPGGRPPSWAAGEAVPWPTAGEKAAQQLEGEEGPSGAEGELPPGPVEPGEGDQQRPKKRKQRDPGDGEEQS
jgi:hypothetical protein